MIICIRSYTMVGIKLFDAEIHSFHYYLKIDREKEYFLHKY
jgi:hypothetical protein